MLGIRASQRRAHVRAQGSGARARRRAPGLREALLVLLLSPCVLCGAVAAESGGLQRVVSLNPSLTAIAVALGAADRLVAIDDYSAKLEPGLAALPRVGGLHSPNLEAVVALAPDAVVLVPSVAQRDFRARLEALDIRVEVFENTRFDQVLENVERMGRLLARDAEAKARIAAIEAARVRAAEVGRSRPSPKVVLVIQREPLYIVGRGSFMAEMVAMLGATSLGDAFSEPYPRVDVEWLVAAAPDVVVDLTDDEAAALAYWRRFASMPAVQQGRVHAVPAGEVSLPGPDLDRALAVLAGALHGEAAARAVAGGANAAEPAS